MALELIAQPSLPRWMNELPLGALLFLVDPGPYDGAPWAAVQPPWVLEHEGRRVTLGLMPVAPFGRASDADRDHLARALAPLNKILSGPSGRDAAAAWLAILVEQRPAAVYLPRDALGEVVAQAALGKTAAVWRAVAGAG